MPRIIVHAFVIFALCFNFAPGLAIAGSPRDCLLGIATAVEKGDSEAFAQDVDLDAILNQVMTVFLQEVQKTENLPYLPPMLTLMFSQAAGQDTIKQLLLQEGKAFVLNGVASGAFAGKKLAPSQQHGLFAPLFAYASTGRKEIRDIGDPMKTENGLLLPFTIHDYGNDHDYAIIGRVVKDGDKFRLVGIENLDQLFNQIRKEAMEQ